jgi:hypothetical protein
MAGQSEQWGGGKEIWSGRANLRKGGTDKEKTEMIWTRCEGGGGSVLRLAEELQVGGRRAPRRPRKIWRRRIQEDMDILGLEERMDLDRGEWRRFIRTSKAPTT